MASTNQDLAPLDHLLSPDSPALKLVLDSVAVGSVARERDRQAPHAEIDLIRTTRLGALRLPSAEGGAGASIRDLYRVIVTLAAADANVAHILRAHFAFVEVALRSPGSRRRWAGVIATGAIFAGAATELGPGAVGGVAAGTKLEQRDGESRLVGVKYYSTGSLYADWLLFTATDELGEPAIALVPAHRQGVILEDDWDGIGQRLTASGTTRLEDVLVDPADMLDPAAQALAAPRFAMPQLYLTAVIAGILRSIAGDACALILSREGRPFAHAGASPRQDPLLQQVVGEIASSAFVAESAVLAAADAIDAEAASVVDGVVDVTLAESASLAAAKAKVFVDEAATRAATKLFEVGGASATKHAANLDRHWRNARTIASHNPAIQKAQAIGDHEVNGAPLPQNWFF